MKVLILGATGGTGRQILSQALEAGHEVTVLARNPASVAVSHDRLRVVVGDLTGDASPLAQAMAGQDAVISAIGRGMTFTPDGLIERSVPRILSAMQAQGVRRLIFTSALGVGATYALSPPAAKIFFRTLLRRIYADKLVGDDLIRSSDRDWTIVQPSQLTDGPLTGAYRFGEHLALKGCLRCRGPTRRSSSCVNSATPQMFGRP